MQTVWANVHVHVERGFGASNLGLLGLRKTHLTHDDDSKRHSRYVWQCILTEILKLLGNSDSQVCGDHSPIVIITIKTEGSACANPSVDDDATGSD